MDFKMQGDQGKRLLRQLLYHYVPREMVERPKMGFDVPVGRWLATDLRGWAEDLLDEDKIRQQGFLEPGPIRRCWKEHLAGTRNWQYRLWNVLMFQAWREQVLTKNSASTTRLGNATVSIQ
jgi:asparagine synthase (glutamine-hydrolysing)